MEAEPARCIVCDALGLDSSGYSFTYVASWSDGATELVKDTAERVIECSKQTFQVQDFIRLTEEEATLSKFGRDRAYLQAE